MQDTPTNRFDFIRETAAEIRADRAQEPRKPHSEVSTCGLAEVIAQECERGAVDGCTWVGHTSMVGEAKAKTR